jgi:methylated-DNA-[protein]-cysteine S-methyltransferase
MSLLPNIGVGTMKVQRLFLESLDTPTGKMRIVTDEEGRLRALDWESHDERMRRLLQRHLGTNDFELVEPKRPSKARRSLEAYFKGKLEAVEELKTATGGTDFQRAVWKALRRIPAGETISYGELAKRIGKPKAMRAVGLANGANPIAIVVPCHRVIGADATLTGYGGGLDRKRWLLAHERAHTGAGSAAQPELAL